jgi:hypothetical protein
MSKKYQQIAVVTVTGLMTTFVVGFGPKYYAQHKDGAIAHDQGHVILCEKVDTWHEAYQVFINTCEYTDHKWGNGCAYCGDLVIGPWIFSPDSTDLGICYQNSGWNRESMGIMLIRTEDVDFNRLTYHTYKKLLKDKLIKHGGLTYNLTHELTSHRGKEDPRPYKHWMMQDGLIWDGRMFPDRIEGLPTDPPDWLYDY